MADLSLVIGFDWDHGNSRKSLDKHSVTPTEAEEAFTSDQLVNADDVTHSAAEVRYQALGKTLDGRLLHITFTLRRDGTLIRIISVRDMNRKERARYERQA